MIASPNGIEVPRHSLAELTKQCRHHNVFPIFLPNTYWNKSPLAVFRILKALVDDHVESLARLSANELTNEVHAMPVQLQQLLGEAPANPFEPDYLKRFSLYWMAASIGSIYSDFRSAFEPMNEESEVAQVFPEILNLIDDDGLLTVDDRFQLADGAIFYKDHVLHYHQCLRRAYGSNPNFDFLTRFAAYYRKSHGKNIFKIAIDPRRVMHVSTYQQIMEFDTWYGALFDANTIDDLNIKGLTVIERERPSLYDIFGYRIDRTEFYWSSDLKNALKSFEIEELSACETKYDTYHINRYVHAERDINRRVLRHFDGAVKIYDNDTAYKARYETHLPQEPRAWKKPKLFRIDGNVDLADWTELITTFMKGNEMVIKYFDPSQYETLFRETIDSWKKLREL